MPTAITPPTSSYVPSSGDTPPVELRYLQPTGRRPARRIVIATKPCASGQYSVKVGDAHHELPPHGMRADCISGSVVSVWCGTKEYVLGIDNSQADHEATIPDDAPAPGPGAPHIVMLGMDSVSRRFFLRHMPLVMQLLRDPVAHPDHEFFDLEYYHSVGHNTAPNVHALFGNLSMLVSAAHPQKQVLGHDTNGDGYADAFIAQDDHGTFHKHDGWMWLEAKRRGYAVWWMEQTANLPGRKFQPLSVGPFMMSLKGYPAELDMVNPYWEDVEGLGRKRPACTCVPHPKNECDRAMCFGTRMRHGVVWDRLLDAWMQRAHQRPTLLVTMSAWAHTHPKMASNRQAAVDWHDADGLRRLLASPQAKNAAILLWADHGLNFGMGEDMQNTASQNMESKRPVLMALLPKSWLDSAPGTREAVRHNQRALATHFDVYRTLLELMEGVPGAAAGRSAPWQRSLLQPIPLDRACHQAHIAPTYCTCAAWRDVPLSAVVRAAIERALNDRLPGGCMQGLGIQEVDECKQARFDRTDGGVVVKRWWRFRGTAMARYSVDTVTRVTFRLNQAGNRPSPPVMLAVVYQVGDVTSVTELRQLTSYAPHIGCLTSLPAGSTEYKLAAERCVCPSEPRSQST